MKDVIRCLKYVLNELDCLSEDELQAIINNKAKLSVVYNKDSYHKKTTSKAVNDNFSVEIICCEIDKLSSVDEVRNYLDNIRPTKSILRGIAKYYNVSVTTKDTNDVLKKKIVDGTIGAKIKFRTLLDTEI